MKHLIMKSIVLLKFCCLPLFCFSQYDPDETLYGGDCNGAATDGTFDFYKILVDSVNLYNETPGSFFYNLRIDSVENPESTDTTWAFNAGNACVCSNLGLNPHYDFRKILNYLLWIHRGKKIKFPNCTLTVGRGKFYYYNSPPPATAYRKMKNDTFYVNGISTCDGEALSASVLQATESQPIGLYMYPNTSIYFPPKSLLKSKAAQTQNANAIAFFHTCNTTLCGLKLDGPNTTVDIDSALDNYGGRIQDGPGAISMMYSKNISIYNTTLKYSSGDGISMSRYYKYSNNENIKLENIRISKSGRSGISVVSVKDLYISNLTIDSTGVSKTKSCANTGLRSLVWAGINIEPNSDIFGGTPISKRCQLDGDIIVNNYLSLNNRGNAIAYLGIANLNDDAKYLDPLTPELNMQFCNLQDSRTSYFLSEKNTCSSVLSNYFWGYGASLGLWVLPGASSISDIKVKGKIDIINPILDRGGVDDYYMPYTTSGAQPITSSALKVNLYNPTFLNPTFTAPYGTNINNHLNILDTTIFPACGSSPEARPASAYPDSDAALIISPNPANSTITIRVIGEILENIDVFSMEGKKILSMSVPATDKYVIDLSYLRAGTYIASIKTDKTSRTRKITVIN